MSTSQFDHEQAAYRRQQLAVKMSAVTNRHEDTQTIASLYDVHSMTMCCIQKFNGRYFLITTMIIGDTVDWSGDCMAKSDLEEVVIRMQERLA